MMTTRTYVPATSDATRRTSSPRPDRRTMLGLDRDSIIRNTLRNPWVWVIAACLVLVSMH